MLFKLAWPLHVLKGMSRNQQTSKTILEKTIFDNDFSELQVEFEILNAWKNKDFEQLVEIIEENRE